MYKNTYMILKIFTYLSAKSIQISMKLVSHEGKVIDKCLQLATYLQSYT